MNLGRDSQELDPKEEDAKKIIEAQSTEEKIDRMIDFRSLYGESFNQYNDKKKAEYYSSERR